MTDKGLEFARMMAIHLEEVLAIERASFSDPWSESMFRQELEEGPGKLSMVLILDSLVIGYGLGWLVLDEFHLGNLAVRPDLKGKGYGSLILERIVGTAREKGCQQASLEVRASNSSAINLYHKFGFKEIAIRKRYYQDEDALVMMARWDGDPAC